MEILNIFKSETKKMLIIQRRYFLNFLADMLVYYFVFMGLYIFIKSNMNIMSAEEINRAVTTQFVGYICWFFFSFTISFMNNGIYRELLEGTFEQVCINHHSIMEIYVIRLIIYFIRNIVLVLLLSLLLMISTNIKLDIGMDTIMIFMISLLGIAGFSFMIGGATLIYKNVGQLSFIISILFLGTSIVDLSVLPSKIQKIIYSLPFTKSVSLLKNIEGINYKVGGRDILFLFINSIIYLILGIIIFKLSFKKAAKEGSFSRF